MGGEKTLALKELYKKDFSEGSAAIVAGGQVIGAGIEVLFKFLKHSRIILFAELLRYYILSKAGINRAEKLIKRYGCRTEFPYIISRKDLNKNCRIFYSNCGANIDPSQKEAVQNIREADYISLRDEQGYRDIKAIRDDAFLTPDAAVLMSDFFPLERLRNEVSDKVKNLSKKFLAFEINLNYYKQYSKQIIDSLTAFSESHKDIDIVLVPIGYAVGHDDLKALRLLKKAIPHVKFIERLTVKEIMYLIASSEMFAGTSLHRIVTAMSFAVPYTALGTASSKLDNFVKTWGKAPFERTDSPDKISEIFDKRAEYSVYLRASAENQKKLARENYDRIFSLLRK